MRLFQGAMLPSILLTPANRASMPDADVAASVQAKALADVILFLAGAWASAPPGPWSRCHGDRRGELPEVPPGGASPRPGIRQTPVSVSRPRRRIACKWAT